MRRAAGSEGGQLEVKERTARTTVACLGGKSNMYRIISTPGLY